jgi:LysM repeat protein
LKNRLKLFFLNHLHYDDKKVFKGVKMLKLYRQLVTKFAVLAFCLCFYSCETYTTYLPNDPFFIPDPISSEGLAKNTNQYVQREDAFESDNTFSPKEGETYEEFETRIFNTLVFLEQKQFNITQEIAKKSAHLASLKDQKTMMMLRHIDLRIDLASYFTPGMTQKAPKYAPFTTHKVNEGDTLQKIAMKYYETHRAWLTIYQFNIKYLEKGPNKITAGMHLVIPKTKNQKIN